MDYDDLLAMCESEIESHLLGALYPNLGPDAQKEIEAQHMIDYYDMPVTLPDFAFPYLRIAIYCDGYEYHWERDPFQKDRQQARALQLQGWLVLRFAGSEILNDTDAVVLTIESDTTESAGTLESRETVTDAKGKASCLVGIRSGIDRGGSVDDTDQVLLPYTVLSSDLWLIRYRLSELISGGHLDSYTQTEIRERPATSPSAEPTSRSVQEQAERPVPVAMPPVLYALLYLPRGTRPAL